MQASFRVPENEIMKRIQLFQDNLSNLKLDGALIVQRVDMFYFTGTAQNGFLFIPSKGEPILLIKKYYPRAKEETALSSVIEIKSTKEVPEIVRQYVKGHLSRLGLEMDILPVRDYQFYTSLFRHPAITNISPLVLALRMKKSLWEVEQLKKAAQCSSETFLFASNSMVPGITEVDLASSLLKQVRRAGHGARIRFRNVNENQDQIKVIAGPLKRMDSAPSAILTLRKSSNFPLKFGEPVLVDIKWMLNGYHIHERRLFALGDVPDTLKSALEALSLIQDEMYKSLRPGTSSSELFNIAYSKATSIGYEKEFLRGLGVRDVPRSCIGYGIGLEVVEPPFITGENDEKLMKGSILVLRPSLLVEGNYFVSTANVVMLTEEGYEYISKTPNHILTH